MQFRLTYTGKLVGASRNNTRAKHKHEIRKCFHPQLKRLWETHPQLKNHVAGGVGLFGSPDYLAEQFQRNGFRFVPLVWEKGFLYCNLEVLMLRSGKAQSVVQDGDLDGRMKVLFDALRMPKSVDELAGNLPAKDEQPFYCLLEDDNLITKASIESDVLLESVQDCSAQNQARVVINVQVKASILRGGGYGSI